MGITVERHPNDKVRIFLISGKSIFPVGAAPKKYTNPQEALEEDHALVAFILGYDKHVEFAVPYQVNGSDAVAVGLLPHVSWDSPMKSQTFPGAGLLKVVGGTSMATTFEKDIIKSIEEKFITTKKPVYGLPQTDISNANDTLKNVETFVETSLKTSNDTNKSIFAVFKEHGGVVKPISYDPTRRSLTSEMSGACTNGCHGSKAVTQMRYTAEIRERFPNIVKFDFNWV